MRLFLLVAMGIWGVNLAWAEPPAIVAVTPTVTASANYVSGNQVGGVMTLTVGQRSQGQAFVLRNVTVVDKGKVGAPLDILLFNGPSPVAPVSSDRTAVNIPTAQMGSSCIGMVQVVNSDYVNVPTGGSVATVKLTGISAQADPAVGAIYAVAIGKATFAYTSASDLVLKFGLEPVPISP